MRPQLISEGFNKNQLADKNFAVSVDIARQMSKIFGVSAQAMQIKLKNRFTANFNRNQRVI